jgi:hypothetical protein
MTIKEQRVYVGELYFPDGTYDLIGGQIDYTAGDNYVFIGIQISDEEEKFIDAFLSHDEAHKTTELAAELRNAESWKVTYLDLTFDDEQDPYEI